MKIALVFVMLLAAAVAVWHYRTLAAARSEELARVLRLDPQKVEASTRALLLLEMIPHLEDSERELAVTRLRRTLEAVPRGLLIHQPSFAVESLRFSANGRAVLWYGKTTSGTTIERWSDSMPSVAPWHTVASEATFFDDAGIEINTLKKDNFRKRNTGTGRTESTFVMSRDGGYVAAVEDGVLFIWRMRDAVAHPPITDPAFQGEVPYATTLLHCVQSADLCGVESRGRFTIVDVKKRKTLRSIVTDRAAIVHISPSGRLVGVAGARAGMTIHSVRDGRKVHVDMPGLALEDFAFSADEKSVVAVDRDHGLHSYDVATGKPAAQSQVLHHEQWKSPSHIETVGDGRFVVWGAEKVRLVSADLSTVTGRFDDDGDVAMLKMNPRGDRLAIVRQTGLLTLWDVSSKLALPLTNAELIESACGHVGRPLTAEEWATYVPNRRYAPRCH
jgi:hypothetical protein